MPEPAPAVRPHVGAAIAIAPKDEAGQIWVARCPCGWNAATSFSLDSGGAQARLDALTRSHRRVCQLMQAPPPRSA